MEGAGARSFFSPLAGFVGTGGLMRPIDRTLRIVLMALIAIGSLFPFRQNLDVVDVITSIDGGGGLGRPPPPPSSRQQHNSSSSAGGGGGGDAVASSGGTAHRGWSFGTAGGGGPTTLLA